VSIEKEISQAISNAFDELNLVVRLDCDNDLEVTLLHGKKEISQSYVALDNVFLKIEP